MADNKVVGRRNENGLFAGVLETAVQEVQPDGAIYLSNSILFIL
jgi:hypothetical protein